MLNELWKMTAHQVKEANFTKAIISIGSCEAHGQHIAEGCWYDGHSSNHYRLQCTL